MNTHSQCLSPHGILLSEHWLHQQGNTTQEQLLRRVLESELSECCQGCAELGMTLQAARAPLQGSGETSDHFSVLVQCLEAVDLTKTISQRVRPYASVSTMTDDQGEEGPGSSSRTNKRLLKLLLTDGQHQFSAIEYKPCPTLDQLCFGGKLKLRILKNPCNPIVSLSNPSNAATFVNGLLFVTPQCFDFYGGHSKRVQEVSERALTALAKKLSGRPQPQMPGQRPAVVPQPLQAVHSNNGAFLHPPQHPNPAAQEGKVMMGIESNAAPSFALPQPPPARRTLVSTTNATTLEEPDFLVINEGHERKVSHQHRDERRLPREEETRLCPIEEVERSSSLLPQEAVGEEVFIEPTQLHFSSSVTPHEDAEEEKHEQTIVDAGEIENDVGNRQSFSNALPAPRNVQATDQSLIGNSLAMLRDERVSEVQVIAEIDEVLESIDYSTHHYVLPVRLSDGQHFAIVDLGHQWLLSHIHYTPQELRSQVDASSSEFETLMLGVAEEMERIGKAIFTVKKRGRRNGEPVLEGGITLSNAEQTLPCIVAIQPLKEK